MITVDLTEHTAVKDRRPFIRNGSAVNGYTIRPEPVTVQELEQAYQAFKTSVPANNWDRSRYFYAKQASELTTRQLITGQNRQNAKEALELLVLEGILNGSLQWPKELEWFWQPGSDPDLVLLKEWFL